MLPENIDTFGIEKTKVVSLTFDDGPGEGTDEIVKLLEENQIEAAFFVVGENVVKNPSRLLQERRVRPGGLQNIIGNHSYTHPHLNDGLYLKDPDALYLELIKTHQAIRAVLGEHDFFTQSKGVLYFRAPFGDWDPLDQTMIRNRIHSDPGARELRKYYGPVYWDDGGEIMCEHPVADAPNSQALCDGQALTDAADWDCWDNNMTVERCAEGYFNKIVSYGGGVVLSHDVYAQTAEMWKILIPKLKSAGFTFVRLDKLPSAKKAQDLDN